MSKYTPTSGLNYTPGNYKAPIGGGTSPTYSDPFASQSQTKVTTSYQSSTNYQPSGTQQTRPQTINTDAGYKPNYSSPIGGSYSPSGRSYNVSGGSYTPSGSNFNSSQTTNGKPSYQPQVGGYVPQNSSYNQLSPSNQQNSYNQQSSYNQPSTYNQLSPSNQQNSYNQQRSYNQPNSYNQPKPTNSLSLNQGPIKTTVDVKVEMRVEPIQKPQVVGNLDSKAKIGKDIFKQTMIKTTSTSSYEGLMTRLRATGEIFRDSEFSADLKSLTGEITDYPHDWLSVVWRTPDEFWGPGYAIFQQGIDPNDIKQGALGDCYFLSTLSALAEVPTRITKLFEGTEANDHGCYAVKICDMGEWKEVIVDNLFPCKNKTSGPIFTRGSDHELWVLILEKAWAKLYGSYAKIKAGFTQEVLHDLTGGPTECFLTEDGDSQKIWTAIDTAEKKNHVMTCGSGDLAGGSDLLTSCGLVGSHAYSLLSAVTVNTNQGPKNLVKLRNPWGQSEWKGAWSDESSLWTPELKKQVNLEDQEDGTFYMAFEDFIKYFSDIQICRVHDDYEYSSHRFSTDPKHATYLRFTIAKEGHYYITINQKSKRYFGPDYEYSDVYLIVGKELPGEEFEYVQGIQRADREVWTDGHLKPGNYVAYVKVLWQDQQPHDVTISTYGFSKTTFETVPKTIIGHDFLEKVYLNKAINSPELKSYAAEGESNAFRCSEFTDDGFGYFFFWNKSESVLQTEISFLSLAGVKLRKPYSGKKFKVTVHPNQKFIVVTKFNPSFIQSKPLFKEVANFQINPGQLKNLAKERGEKNQRKHQKTGEMVDIWCYVLRHSDGVFFYYENNTKDLTLDEEIKFRLQGLRIEDDSLKTSAKFLLPPGQNKEIKLKKTVNEFTFVSSPVYVIKN